MGRIFFDSDKEISNKYVYTFISRLIYEIGYYFKKPYLGFSFQVNRDRRNYVKNSKISLVTDLSRNSELIVYF